MWFAEDYFVQTPVWPRLIRLDASGVGGPNAVQTHNFFGVGWFVLRRRGWGDLWAMAEERVLVKSGGEQSEISLVV